VSGNAVQGGLYESDEFSRNPSNSWRGATMKTLLVRPGVEIVEKTLKGPWPPKLTHLEKVYKNPELIFRGLIALESFSSSSPIAVGSVLKKLGEDVEFLDVPFEFGIPLTEEKNVKRHEKIEEYCARGYDVVGISCTSILECLATQKIAETAKNISKDTLVVVGGYQAASDAHDFMRKIPDIDVIVLSDFEPIAEQLYASFNGKGELRDIPNIGYRKNNTVCISKKNIPLKSEDLPVFDYSLARKYIPQYAFVTLEASRGCPYMCSFCQEKVVRQSYTVKDAFAAVDEIIDTANYCAQFFEPVALCFCDALWGINPEWVKEFCLHLIARKDEIMSKRFGWGVEARIDQFDDDNLLLMKKAGCSAIGYGVESLSPTMLEIMSKTRNPQNYIASVFNTIESMSKIDMHTVLLFILGMPGETPLTLKETLDSIKKLSLKGKNLHFQFGLPIPLRGTILEKQIHDPSFAVKYGVNILDEFRWEKVYLPRLTLLFDPSRDFSASEMTDIFLNITGGGHGVGASLEKQAERFEEVRTILERDQISPDELAQWGAIYREITTKIL
jgi:radical SAM superfamily enzyme YgiQ (UPF0313 family)